MLIISHRHSSDKRNCKNNYEMAVLNSKAIHYKEDGQEIILTFD